MSRASLAVVPRPLRRNPAPAALHEWRAAVSVWAALPPRSRKEAVVCRHLLELQTRLGSEASLIAQEARQ